MQPTNERNLSACILWIQLPYISTERVNSKTQKVTQLIAKVNLTYTSRHYESDSLPGSSGKHTLICLLWFLLQDIFCTVLRFEASSSYIKGSSEITTNPNPKIVWQCAFMLCSLPKWPFFIILPLLSSFHNEYLYLIFLIETRVHAMGWWKCARFLTILSLNCCYLKVPITCKTMPWHSYICVTISVTCFKHVTTFAFMNTYFVVLIWMSCYQFTHHNELSSYHFIESPLMSV